MLENSPLVFYLLLQLFGNLLIKTVALKMVDNRPLSSSLYKVESLMLTARFGCFPALRSASTSSVLASSRFYGQFSLCVSQFGPSNQREFKWLDPLLAMSAGLSFVRQCCQVMHFFCLILATLLATKYLSLKSSILLLADQLLYHQRLLPAGKLLSNIHLC